MNIIIQGPKYKVQGILQRTHKKVCTNATGLYQKICIGQTRYKPCSTTTREWNNYTTYTQLLIM